MPWLRNFSTRPGPLDPAPARTSWCPPLPFIPSSILLFDSLPVSVTLWLCHIGPTADLGPNLWNSCLDFSFLYPRTSLGEYGTTADIPCDRFLFRLVLLWFAFRNFYRNRPNDFGNPFRSLLIFRDEDFSLDPARTNWKPSRFFLTNNISELSTWR